MAKMPVKNDHTKPIRVGRDVLKPGEVKDIDEALLYTDRVQRLRTAKKLVFPFRPQEKPAEPPVEPVAEPEVTAVPDDLTALANIGQGRAKKLNQFGVFTYAQVVEHEQDLHEILEITEEMAAEVVADAKSRI